MNTNTTKEIVRTPAQALANLYLTLSEIGKVPEQVAQQHRLAKLIAQSEQLKSAA